MNNASPETRQQRRFRARQERKQPHPQPKNAFKRAMQAFEDRAEVLKAAAAMLPIDAKLAFMALAARIGNYRSRGHGLNRPSYAHGRGSRGGSWPEAHQSGQEALRRAVGGWAFYKRCTGLTKNETFQLLAPHGKVKIERAIAMLKDLQRQPRAA